MTHRGKAPRTRTDPLAEWMISEYPSETAAADDLLYRMVTGALGGDSVERVHGSWRMFWRRFRRPTVTTRRARRRSNPSVQGGGSAGAASPAGGMRLIVAPDR